jgi:glycosyltransferase involved in cell wall biosynthesis
MRIAHVSTFPPLKCGIAFFASDLIEALPNSVHSKYSLHYGRATTLDARSHANVNSLPEIIALAKSISASDCDVVGIQHEFGIWGGEDGHNLQPFLDNLTKPVVSILHTTCGPGVRADLQNRLLLSLIERSARVVLLTEASAQSTAALAGRQLPHAVVIPHGVPRFPYREPPALSGDQVTLRLITPGFFRENKGLEIVLEALRTLRLKGREFDYLIAGEGQGQFSRQARYVDAIETLIKDFGLEGVARCEVRFFQLQEQIEAIHSCHFGIFAYQDCSQSSSGTIPLVLGSGRPVICTPFEYAKAKNLEGFPVIIAEGFDAINVAAAIERTFDIADDWDPWQAAFSSTFDWAWPRIGIRFEKEFRRAAFG